MSFRNYRLEFHCTPHKPNKKRQNKDKICNEKQSYMWEYIKVQSTIVCVDFLFHLL